MGISYLMRMLEWYLTDEKKFLFHIEENGVCLGYCGGIVYDGTQVTGSASGMIQYSFNKAIISILTRPWLLLNKEFLDKQKLVIKNVKMKLKQKKIKANNSSDIIKRKREPIEIQTGLVVIGVSKGSQGKGYGSMLLKEFETKTKSLNIKLMSLTVLSDNFQAVRSYERNGWVKSLLKDNSLEMIKRLD